MDLQKLYRKLLNKGRVDRVEAKQHPKGLSAKTVRNINQVISSAMDFAVAQKIIPENPCRAVALPKVEHKEMQTIPAEQLQTFLQEAKATGVYEMYYIELATGLRRGELLGLKWTDIDWNNGIIKVRRQVSRVDGQIVEAPLKTKNSYRTVTISQQAIEVLKQQKEKTNDEYVFPVAVPGRCFARRSGLASRRPLPLAQVAPPATGGAPIAPPPPTAAPSRQTV